jgi:UDP-glucose 4-epimerase
VKAVVTGASGFVGESLVTELVRRGWDVECLGRRRPAPRPGVAWHMADLGNPAGFASALRARGKGAVLFHLAAAMPTHRPAPDDDMLVRANVLSPLRLFQEAVEMGIPRVVFASSISVIGTAKSLPITEEHPVCPISSYAITKLGGELYAEMLR